MPASDIPEKGLETEWVVTTKTVQLAALTEDISVTTEQVENSQVWTAKFSLHIPKQGESATAQLHITPQAAERAGLDILIFARKNLYRQFSVELSVIPNNEVHQPIDSPVARVTGEVIHSPAGELGLHAAHEWLTPPGTLTITVLRNAGAYVRGTTGLGEIDTQTDWHGASSLIAGPIKNVRDAAEAFRIKYDTYLNNIDQTDLVNRMLAATSDPQSFMFFDNADQAHQQAWDNDVAISDEMNALAYHGYILYQTLFPDNSDLRNWLDSLSPGWRINISWSDITGPAWVPHVPWGLMYRTPPPKVGQPIKPMDLIGLRFRINYVAHDIKNPKSKALGSFNQTYRANCLYWGTQPDDQTTAEAKWQHLQWAQWNTQDVFISSEIINQSPREALLSFLDNPTPNPGVSDRLCKRHN